MMIAATTVKVVRLVLLGAMIFIIIYLLWLRHISRQKRTGGLSSSLLTVWACLAAAGLVGRLVQHGAGSDGVVLLGLRLCHTAFFLLIPCMTLAIHRLTGMPAGRFFVLISSTALLFVALTWTTELVISDALISIQLIDGSNISGPKPAPLSPLVFPVLVIISGYIAYLWRKGPRPLTTGERPVLVAFLVVVVPATVNDALLYAGALRSVELFDSALALHAVAGALIMIGHNARLHGKLEEAVRERTLELQQREQQLEHALSMRQQLLAAMPYGVLVLHDEIIGFANAAAHFFFDKAAGTLEGTPLRELVHPHDRPLVEHDALLDDAVRARFEVGGTTRVGELVRLEVGSVGGSRQLVVIRDLTEQHSLRQQLQHSDRLAAIGTLSAGVAHEINNPLTFIKGNLCVIEEQLGELEQLPAAQSELAEVIADCLEGTDRIARIVNDLRSLSRVDDELSPIDIRQPLQKAIRMTAIRYGQRVRFTSKLDDVEPVVAAAGRLDQVFLNLLLNAAQSLPEGSDEQLLVQTRCFSNEGGGVVIEVEDNGVGVPASLRERVFEPFYTSKPVGEGTGLGLSICAGIVNSLDGSLQLAPATPKGTIARVVLPACGERRPRSGGHHALEAAQQSHLATTRARILLVDDDELLVAGMVRLLRDTYDVTPVHSGAEALQRVARESFDAVLCDLMMPGLSGVDVFEEAERQGWHDKIVLVTAGATTKRAARLLERDDVIWLAKPVSRKQMIETLEASMARQRRAQRRGVES